MAGGVDALQVLSNKERCPSAEIGSGGTNCRRHISQADAAWHLTSGNPKNRCSRSQTY